MRKKIMALCDSEKEYLDNLAAFLKGREDFPFELHTYTEPEKLLAFGEKEQIEVLMVAESDFTYEVSRMKAGHTLLLNESGIVAGEHVRNVDKYQKAENVWRELLAGYADVTTDEGKRLCAERARIIGLYSPIKRCLQTSFALTLGQTLAESRKTLYVSFEHYAGWNQLLDHNTKGDLAALVYFQSEQGEKFLCRMQSMTMKIGKLFYIPPVYAGQNLIYVSAREWRQLVERIAAEAGYEYIILDLSDSIQGTFELLQLCDKIYTIVREDERARAKLAQYEALLEEYECGDVLDRTSRQVLPHFERLPERIEQFTYGELAEYIRTLVKDDWEVA